MGFICTPGDKVLLKVNLIGSKSSDSAAVTHSEFVRAVARILKQRGCEVWIGDSSGGAIGGIAPTAKSFRTAGYEKAAMEEGAVKNVFGCIPGLRKARYHKMAPNPESFGEILADIHQNAEFKLPKRYKSGKKRNNKVLIKVIDFFKTAQKVNRKKCRNCNVCVESCPVKAINRDTKQIDYKVCIECMCCHELCMYKAVELKKENFLAGILIGLNRGKYR